MPEHLARDFHCIDLIVAERLKREPTLKVGEAVMSVIADCLMKNEDPGYMPKRVFLDWNWYRLDCYKLARKIAQPKGVPGHVLHQRWLDKQPKAA